MHRLFPFRAFVQTAHCERFGEAFDMQAIANASCSVEWDRCNFTIAIIIARTGAMEHPQANNLAACDADLNNPISVLCFSSVSIVHNYSMNARMLFR
jgi:hypothetical protein